jgi:carboxyl-terminal processing protease
MIDNITRQPFNFSVDESVIASREATFDFAASTEELQKRWYRYLKFATARGIYYALHKDNLPVQAAKSSIDKVEPSIRNKLRGNEKKFIEDILHYKAGLESYMAEIYLDAIASEFDPHTNYFSQEGKEEFQSALSSQGLSFGIDFDENQKGQIVVDHLEPGGPAWKSGELHKNDELLQLQQEGKEPVDITEQSVEDIYEFLAAPGHDKINFKVRKNNGQEKTVTLKKEKINNEENVVKSFVLNGSKKIGYIILPGFYTEWENDGGSSCANDVAREIIKLKHENIEGLILDVRFNGGGSVGESLAMAGIFIDEGPLSGEKDKSGKLVFLKDPNRGVIFSGPMILLVNGQSASASELLAATLQDYNRALIMGGKTFGKATMQQMFFLDTLSKKAPNARTNTDILKITTGKIFRLNGETAQLKGVVPDIELPDEFELMKSGERFYANALPADTARKNNYYKPLPAIPIAELATKSAARTSRDPGFIRIQKSIADLKAKQIQQTEIIPLKWEGFDKWLSGKEMAGKEEEKDNIQEPSVFTASVAELNKQWTTDNEDAKEWNNRMIKNIQNDIYMQEAFRVLCDWIGLQKTSR